MKKPNIDECAALCRAALKRNLQKIIVSIGVMFILGNCSSLLALGALAAFAGRFSLLFCAALLVFLYTLFFGFAFLALRFVRRERAVIGDLFCGFRNFKRTALSSLPFLLVLFAAVFACSFASVFLLLHAENADAFAALGEGKISPVFTGTALAALGISLVFWLPLAFTPLFVVEKPNYTVRECVSASVELFKEAWRVLLGAFARLCWKLLAAFAASALAVLCFRGESPLAFLGVLATPVLSLSLYALFACAVTLYAAVFSECARLNSEPPSPPVPELAAATSGSGASLPSGAASTAGVESADDSANAGGADNAESANDSASANDANDSEAAENAASSSNAESANSSASSGDSAGVETSSNAESADDSASANGLNDSMVAERSACASTSASAENAESVGAANNSAGAENASVLSNASSAGGAEASGGAGDDGANGGGQPLS